MSDASVQELIESAFAEVSYPGDDNIVSHNCPECDEVRAFFRGKLWRDLKFPDLAWHRDSLPLLTPQALQYFLPGYMLASLGNWEEADIIPDSISYGWMPTEDDEAENMHRYIVARRSPFSRTQRMAIAAFLRESEKHGYAFMEQAISMLLDNDSLA